MDGCFKSRGTVWEKGQNKRGEKGRNAKMLGEPDYHTDSPFQQPLLPRRHFAKHLSVAELKNDAQAKAALLKGQPA